MIKIKGQRNVNGAVLDGVKIVLGDGSVKTNDGTFQFKNKIKNPANFNNWVFVYSYGKNSKFDDDDADKALGLFRSCSKAFGINVEDPGFITVSGNSVNDWKK